MLLIFSLSVFKIILGFVAGIGVLVVLIPNILFFTLFTVHVVLTYLLPSLSFSRSNVYSWFSRVVELRRVVERRRVLERGRNVPSGVGTVRVR